MLLRFLFILLWLWTAVPSRGTTVVPPSFGELVNESDCIVRTQVKRVTSEWREKQGSRRIYTLVELEVHDVISGTAPQTLILQLLGGRIDDQEMVVDGVPTFAVGQEDILFVRGNGRQFCPLTAIMHGRYPVLKAETSDRAYIARANSAPLMDVSEVSHPMAEENKARSPIRAATISQAITPEIFIQQIRAALDLNYRPAHAKQ